MGFDSREPENTSATRLGFLLLGVVGIIIAAVWLLTFVGPNPDPVKNTQKFVDQVNVNLVIMAAYALVVAGLILGLASLYSTLSNSNGERLALAGLVTGALSGILIMADWGALTMGSIAVADAYKDGNTGVVPAMKYLEGGNLPGQLDSIFMVAGLLALISAVLLAVVMWRSRIFAKWVAIVFAVGLVFFAVSIPPVSLVGGILLAVSGFTMARAIGGERQEAVSPARPRTA